jgi:hypothetical protein
MAKKNNITIFGNVLYLKKGKDKSATLIKVDRSKHAKLYWYLRDNGEKFSDEYDPAVIKNYYIEPAEWQEIVAEIDPALVKLSIWFSSEIEAFVLKLKPSDLAVKQLLES